jgi:hypothetical protein
MPKKMDKKEDTRISMHKHQVSRGGVTEADWKECLPDILSGAVAAVGAGGGALRLGYTSDGGAYAIGIYGDGDPYTEYVRPNEDITEYMRMLMESWLNA